MTELFKQIDIDVLTEKVELLAKYKSDITFGLIGLQIITLLFGNFVFLSFLFLGISSLFYLITKNSGKKMESIHYTFPMGEKNCSKKMKDSFSNSPICTKSGLLWSRVLWKTTSSNTIWIILKRSHCLCAQNFLWITLPTLF